MQLNPISACGGGLNRHRAVLTEGEKHQLLYAVAGRLSIPPACIEKLEVLWCQKNGFQLSITIDLPLLGDRVLALSTQSGISVLGITVDVVYLIWFLRLDGTDAWPSWFVEESWAPVPPAFHTKSDSLICLSGKEQSHE